MHLSSDPSDLFNDNVARAMTSKKEKIALFASFEGHSTCDNIEKDGCNGLQIFLAFFTLTFFQSPLGSNICNLIANNVLNLVGEWYIGR